MVYLCFRCAKIMEMDFIEIFTGYHASVYCCQNCYKQFATPNNSKDLNTSGDSK